jgi:hypothetical protein
MFKKLLISFLFLSLIACGSGSGSSSTDDQDDVIDDQNNEIIDDLPDDTEMDDLSVEPDFSGANLSFIIPDDQITFNPGQNDGFGQTDPSGDQFANLYGVPQNEAHVLSLGFGGEITIQFTDRVIINGEGDDFIVFENALESASGLPIFSERAEVSVSADGVNFISFDCEVDNQANNFPGCAGVYQVNYDEELEVEQRGGDGFDLDDLGLDRIVAIRIIDLETCEEGDHTYPVCIAPISMGFDLSGIGLINYQEINN